ncbi:unnamed protein product [Nippostrongylus brasiliensis]|uniref:glucuronosyltransferase n=1 Tax=Nippostrongylus brasiliensis TaxID=27835 RepID=A0A158QYW4_NIPBR|nr:unnamed protein product [Nippostrongylus brasiliensis]
MAAMLTSLSATIVIFILPYIVIAYDEYTPETFPDSIEQPAACGMREASFICDPSGVLNRTNLLSNHQLLEKALIEVRQITKCTCSPMDSGVCDDAHRGFTMSVAVVRRMKLDNDQRSPTMTGAAAEIFADILRKRQRREERFKKGDYTDGLRYMIESYTTLLKGETLNLDEGRFKFLSQWWIIAIGAVIAVFLLALFVFIVYRCVRLVTMQLCLLLVLFVDCAFGAKILLISMPQGRSHTGSFMALINRLKQEGHHHVSLYMESYPNETTFGLEDLFPFFYGSDSCDIVLKEHRDYFNRMANMEFDLILTDSLFAVCGYGIATLNKVIFLHLRGAINISSTALNFALTPRHFMPNHDVEFKPDHFYYRLKGTIEWISNFVISGVITGERMKMALAPVLPSFSVILVHIFCLYFYFFQLLEYGAYCPTPRSLSGKLLDFVSDPHSKGTILVAFGTVINWKSVPSEKFDAIFETLNSLTDYRIVWSYNGEKIDTKPHIYTSSWIPQVDVLFDSRTVLFFSHGGLKSVKEATCASVPSVFMPMFAEQVRNGWMAKNNVSQLFMLFFNASAYVKYKYSESVLGYAFLQTQRARPLFSTIKSFILSLKESITSIGYCDMVDDYLSISTREQ